MSENETEAQQPNTESAQETNQAEKAEGELAEKLFDHGKEEPEKQEEPEGETDEPESAKPDADKGESKESEESKSEDEQLELKLSEDSPLDKSAIDEISKFAEENGLSKSQAQKIIEHQEKTVRDYTESAKARFNEQTEAWVNDIREDKELGGENFEKSVELASRVFKKYAEPEFVQALQESGWGNHPELVRVFTRIGKAMANDEKVDGRQHGSQPKTYEEVFYGN